MGFASVATFVPTLETTKVGMGFAGVQLLCQVQSWHEFCMGATYVPVLVLAWVLLKRKTGCTSVRTSVGPSERLARHEAQHKAYHEFI